MFNLTTTIVWPWNPDLLLRTAAFLKYWIWMGLYRSRDLVVGVAVPPVIPRQLAVVTGRRVLVLTDS
jgi:lysine/ornithine N-monooxygenase